MPAMKWARLREDVDCGLRRGAWYRTVDLGQSEVMLEVHGRERSFDVHFLEIVNNRPMKWTIVSGARNAVLIPARWRKGYAVCPNCRWRQLPLGQPQALRCEGCNEVFEVAWGEPYLASINS